MNGWGDAQMKFWHELHERVDRGHISGFDRLEVGMADRVFSWLSARYTINPRPRECTDETKVPHVRQAS